MWISDKFLPFKQISNLYVKSCVIRDLGIFLRRQHADFFNPERKHRLHKWLFP